MQFENYGTTFAFVMASFFLGILLARSIFMFILSLDFNVTYFFFALIRGFTVSFFLSNALTSQIISSRTVLSLAEFRKVPFM